MKHRTRNPWTRIPTKPPFVLAEDLPFVSAFNRRASPEQKIDLRLLPEPFFGPFDAPVVVLLQNPGLGAKDLRHHKNQQFAASLRRSLRARVHRVHFHLVDPTRGPGYHWWHRTCKELINRFTAAVLARRLLALEFAPYHSKRFAHAHLRLPSQEFNFSLLRRAIERRAVIVCIRGYREWLGAVPELSSCTVLRTRSKQAAALSSRNLPKYASVVRALT